MLYYLIRHPVFTLLLITTPLLGWYLHKYLPKTVIIILFCVTALLLLPTLTAYRFSLNHAFECLLYCLVASGYALFLSIKNSPVKVTFILLIVLSVPCGLIGLTGEFIGYSRVENEWVSGRYKMVCIKERGIMSAPQRIYQLNEIGSVPLFMKPVDKVIETDTSLGCWIQFKKEGFNFDKCHPDSSYAIKNLP